MLVYIYIGHGGRFRGITNFHHSQSPFRRMYLALAPALAPALAIALALALILALSLSFIFLIACIVSCTAVIVLVFTAPGKDQFACDPAKPHESFAPAPPKLQRSGYVYGKVLGSAITLTMSILMVISSVSRVVLMPFR